MDKPIPRDEVFEQSGWGNDADPNAWLADDEGLDYEDDYGEWDYRDDYDPEEDEEPYDGYLYDD